MRKIQAISNLCVDPNRVKVNLLYILCVCVFLLRGEDEIEEEFSTVRKSSFENRGSNSVTCSVYFVVDG